MAEDMTPPPSAGPSSANVPGALPVLVGLLLAPLAWLFQVVTAETLAAQRCYPFGRPLSAPVVPWLQPALVAIGAVCLAAGVFGTLTAWRNLRRIGPMEWGALSGARRTRAELTGFLSRVAAMCSALFLFALVSTDVVLAIMSPCKWW